MPTTAAEKGMLLLLFASVPTTVSTEDMLHLLCASVPTSSAELSHTWVKWVLLYCMYITRSSLSSRYCMAPYSSTILCVSFRNIYHCISISSMEMIILKLKTLFPFSTDDQMYSYRITAVFVVGYFFSVMRICIRVHWNPDPESVLCSMRILIPIQIQWKITSKNKRNNCIYSRFRKIG